MKQKIFITGMRPTNRLTIANYLGGIQPLLEMQEKGEHIHIFVATLHGLTTDEPKDIMSNIINIVGDYIAAGINPEKVLIYNQFDIRKEIKLIEGYLNREVSTSRLLRLPTLKDKVKGDNLEQANVSLLTYPILMAADIICQEATHVPVGKDQKPHLELTREIVRSFNRKYGNVLTLPIAYSESDEAVNILSLIGEGKMSKSNSKGAIFLYDSEEEIRGKIKKAQTGPLGEESKYLKNMITITKAIDYNVSMELLELYNAHKSNIPSMARFKEVFADVVVSFTKKFQEKRDSLSDEYIIKVLEEGKNQSLNSCNIILNKMEKAMGLI